MSFIGKQTEKRVETLTSPLLANGKPDNSMLMLIDELGQVEELRKQGADYESDDVEENET